MAYNWKNHDHKEVVNDTDSYFSINAITRSVVCEQQKKTILMQGDHNSERFTFELPRYIEDHDMELCNKVEIHYINVNGSTRESNPGVYAVEDYQITENGDKMTFSWLVSENATVHAGTLSFLVLFACVDEAGVNTYRWYTGINSSITISAGMNNAEVVIEPFVDVLQQWKETLFSKDYAYEAAVNMGFEGTAAEWYDSLIQWGETTTMWRAKQNTLSWVTEEDIDAMIAGTYTSTELDDPAGYYPTYEVVGETLVITAGERLEANSDE